MIVRGALANYFREYNLGVDGGFSKRWAKIRIGTFYIPIPNTRARRKALVLHDIHHIVTGYSGDWKGEASIGAWEIASGCGKYYAAWLLNLWAFAIGLVLFPKPVFVAFVRGKRTGNLYQDNMTQEQALSMTVKELQNILFLNHDNPKFPTAPEIFSFIGWSCVSVVVFSIPFIFPYLILFRLIF